MKAFMVIKTKEIFTTNYIDHHNKCLSKGDYRLNTPLLKFKEVKEIEITRKEFKIIDFKQ